MEHKLKIICILIAALVIFTFIPGCSSGNNDKNSEDEPSLLTKVIKPVKFSFCFTGSGKSGQPGNKNSIDEMLAELNKKTIADLKAEIVLKWLSYENYEANIKKLLLSGDGPDAFMTYNFKDLRSDGLLKDLTDLLPRYALNYYTELKKYWGDEMLMMLDYGDKLDGILNNIISPPQYFILARQDLADKYSHGNIDTFEEYGSFLNAVKQNEKGMIPGIVDSYKFFDAYMKGNGYFNGSLRAFYCEWNAKDIIDIPIEWTDKFATAYELFKQWKKKDLIPDLGENYLNALSKGQVASILQEGFVMHNSYNLFPGADKYRIYPLYKDSKYVITRLPHALAINAATSNAERILMFIEWLQENRDNYDLFMYGIKDKQYRLSGNSLDFSGIDNKSIIAEWPGSKVFRNYLNERAYAFEPENYPEFLQSCYSNTVSIMEYYTKHGYDYQKYLKNVTMEEQTKFEEENKQSLEYIDKRVKIFNDFLDNSNKGIFDITLQDMMKQDGADMTKKVLEFTKLYMDKIKEFSH